MENYGQILDKITYVQTFKALKLRYDQHQDRLRDPQGRGAGGGGQLESVGSILRPGRFKRDPREMDEDEEMWFNDDEFDNDGGGGASNGSNGSDNAQEDNEDAAAATASVPTSSAAAVATVVENQVCISIF